ncbi:MAG: diguanylate cyclase [Lentimicrobiaceae bacterium]|nr:diguanylate cyclase [Lentimicrobiaceae bacterium]
MEISIFDFFKEINVSITISDTEGNVVYMNDKAKSVFGDMTGKNMMSCHKQSSQETIKRLIDEKATNVYTIQKGEVRKMIYQTPWYVDGEIKGLVEYSIILPENMPHYIR